MLNHESSNKLTIEELRAFEGCESISEKDALEIINELYRLSQFTYNIINK